ncbi:MAG TPA: hypothetical protein PLM33_04555 [Acidobacteriota bacterium]|nr:hypothetical protein [Acidobacteriota bacterium]
MRPREGVGDDALSFFVVVGNLDILAQIFQEFVDVDLELRRRFSGPLHLQEKDTPVRERDQEVRPPVLAHGGQLRDLEAQAAGVLDDLLLDRRTSIPNFSPSLTIWIDTASVVRIKTGLFVWKTTF